MHESPSIALTPASSSRYADHRVLCWSEARALLPAVLDRGPLAQVYLAVHQDDDEPSDLSPVDIHLSKLGGTLDGAEDGSMFGGGCASGAISTAAMYYVSQRDLGVMFSCRSGQGSTSRYSWIAWRRPLVSAP